MQNYNATQRCSRLYNPTIEALKLAGKWSEEKIPGPRAGTFVSKTRLLNSDRKLWIVEGDVPRVLFYADVIDKDNINMIYDPVTAAFFGIEAFARASAVCRPARA